MSSSKTVNVKKLFSEEELQTLLPTIQAIPLSQTTDSREQKRWKRQQGKRSIYLKEKTIDRNAVEDLLQIFDQVSPQVELALELQKMTETKMEIIDGSERQRIETQLLSYVSLAIDPLFIVFDRLF